MVEVGTHDELLERKGLYHELVNAQVFADVDGKKGIICVTLLVSGVC